MISKNRLNRFAHGLAAALLAVGFTACSDDTQPVDGPDTGVDGPEPCEGHQCPTNNPTMSLPEGGVVRYELFHMGYENNDAVNGAKIERLGGWAFFFKGQQPDARPLLPAAPFAGGCFDMTQDSFFLSGNTAANQAIVDSRTYYDLGASLSLTRPDAPTIEMAKQPAGEKDPSMWLQHEVMYLTDMTTDEPAMALQRNVSYPVPQIGPVNEFPGLDLRGGFDVMAMAEETDPPAMYFPADFSLNTPTEQEYFGADGTGLTIDASQDLVFTWTNSAAPPADWVGQLQFTGFLDDQHGMKYLCLAPSDGETQTIPAAVFAQANLPQSGLLIHGAITHVAWAQHVSDAEEYRIDVLGVNCKFSSYNLTNVPAP